MTYTHKITYVAVGVNVYVRYKQLEEYAELRHLNVTSFFIGCASALGISIVANFQVSSAHVQEL